METKRLIIAFALSAAVLLIWQVVFPPQRPKRPPAAPAEIAGEPSATPPPQPVGEPPASVATEAGQPAAEGFERVVAEIPEEFEFENDLFQIRFSNQGGRVLSWRLNENLYTTRDGERLEMVPEFRGDEGLFPLAVVLEDPSLMAKANQALYRIQRQSLASGQRIAMVWSDGAGLSVTKALTFRPGPSPIGEPGGYLAGLELEVLDRGRRLPAKIAWGPGFGAQDPKADNSTYYYSGQLLWNRDGSVTRERRQKVDPGEVRGLRWAGLEDQYFAALFVPTEGELSVDVSVAELVRVPPADAEGEAPEEEDPEEVATLAVAIPEQGALLYVGPKKFDLLKGLGLELEKAVWFATNGFLAAISKAVFLALLWVHDHTIANYGMAIVLTTLFLRLLLFPLNQYSMVSIKKSQMAMQRLQPKVNAIKNRYKKKKDAESRSKMNQEMMDMYRKEGVNPMGGLTGCLPLLAQFPILIGFYNMLTVAVELRGAPFFGWIQDLSQKDPYWITPLLMGVTMFVQQKIATTGKTTDPMQRQQQRMMMIMPVFFTYICLQMPSGLVMYWFVNNILGIGQQWLVNRRTGRLEAAAQKA